MSAGGELFRRLWRRPGAAAAFLLGLMGHGPAAMAVEPLPWHLIDYFYSFDTVDVFSSLDIDVDIAGETQPGHYLYIAPLWGKIGGTGFYFGLQTDIAGTRHPGPGMIFSRWGSTTRADAQPAAGGWVEALDDRHSGEGDFVGVRVPYAWGPGSYHFRLDARFAPGGGCWVDLHLLERRTGRTIEGGSLRFPSCDGFYTNPASFIEIYALPPGVTPALAHLPATEIRIHPPVINGFRRPSGASVEIPHGVPPLASTTSDGDGLRAVLSPP